MKKRYLLLILSLCLTSCSHCGYKYCMEGAQEFVLDSYKIQQGKFAILELEGKDFPPLPQIYLREYEDRIDEDDILKIALFHPSRNDLVNSVNRIGNSVGFRVINGEIHMPGIDTVTVKGLTLDDARERIQKIYAQQISNVSVYIEYAQRMHSKVELTGAVRVPAVPINGRIRLYDVLSKAGVPPEANLFKSYFVRDGRLLPVDFNKLLNEGDMSQNVVMRPQDKIFIAAPEAASVTVMGEVGLAKIVPLPSGSISLRQVLAAAGGIPFTGNKRSIQVIRGNILCPKIYRLSWNHITYLPNDSLLLMPGDTVFITEQPITKWNRFINQLLPSSLLIDLGVKTRGVFH